MSGDKYILAKKHDHSRISKRMKKALKKQEFPRLWTSCVIIKMEQRGETENDLYLRTLELAQIQEDEYFGHVISDDLKLILRNIREAHQNDATTADRNSPALDVQKSLQEATNYKGSDAEKQARIFLATFGIDYDAITMEQFVNLIEVLKQSKHLKPSINQRGKTNMTHGKGIRKRK